MNHTILPIPEPEPPTYTELDVRQTQPPPRFQVTAPEGAPNVVIIMIDDLRVEPNKRTKNFIRSHRALKFGKVIRTPAMQAGLVARQLRFRDIFRWSSAPGVIDAVNNI